MEDLQSRVKELGYNAHEIRDMALHHLQAMIQYDEQKRDAAGTYPSNVSFSNFSDFLWAPTLCYEVMHKPDTVCTLVRCVQVSYPRTPTIRVSYIAEKAVTAFGILSLMWYLLENYVRTGFQESAVSDAEHR